MDIWQFKSWTLFDHPKYGHFDNPNHGYFLIIDLHNFLKFQTVKNTNSSVKQIQLAGRPLIKATSLNCNCGHFGNFSTEHGHFWQSKAYISLESIFLPKTMASCSSLSKASWSSKSHVSWQPKSTTSRQLFINASLLDLCSIRSPCHSHCPSCFPCLQLSSILIALQRRATLTASHSPFIGSLLQLLLH